MLAGVVLARTAVGALSLLASIVGSRGRRRRRRGGSRCRVGRGHRQKGRLGLHLEGVTDVILLLKEIRLGVEEGGWGSHGGEDGDRLAELVVQPTEGVDDECGVGDGSAAVIEGVGKALETPAVLANSHVALVQTVELLLGIHRALQAVVEKLAGDGKPDGVGGGIGAVDIVPNFFGDGVVQPRDDAGVDLKPFGVVDHGSSIDGAVDVVDEAEFLEGELDAGPPLPEIAVIGRQHDGDVVADVEQNKSGSSGWSGISRSSEGVGFMGSGRGSRARHGSMRCGSRGGRWDR